MKIKAELGTETPNLSGLSISPTVLERYGVVEARTNLGRRIAIQYLEDCTKLLSWDGSSVWDGDYVPEAGLFGQRQATVRRLVLCAHEFEALRVASVLEDNPKLHMHAVALPTGKALGRLGMAMLVDSLKVVASEILVWNGTVFDSLRDSVEDFVAAIDETSNINVSALSLGRGHSPLDLTSDEILNVLRGATRKWSPANLATAAEIFESEGFFDSTIGYSTGIDGLDKFVRGVRKSELWMYVAGSGVGKSTLLRQQCYHLAYNEGQKIALGFFEETKKETLKKLAALHFGISFETLMEDPHALSEKQYQSFLNLEATRNLHFISQPEKSFGGIDVDTLLNTVRYLKRKENLDFVAIDHISIMVSGKESSKEGERKDIDILMTKLAMACVMLEVGILAVCHLSNPDGKPHEEGGRVFLSHMRGSGSLKQLAWCVIAQERNQQGENNKLVLIRVLKNRNGGGRTGLVAAMEFVDPLLIERTDIDLASLAAEMAEGGGGSKKRDSKRSNVPSTPRHSPFGADNPNKRITFGTLPKEGES